MLLGYKSGMSIDLLPYDAEVEYLQSTGEQYIDTGVLVSSALDDAQIDITYSSSDNTGDLYVFGGGNTYGTAIQMVLSTHTGYTAVSWGENISVGDAYQKDAVTTARMTYNDYSISFGSTTKTGSFTATSRTFSERNIYLFRLNRSSGGINNNKTVRINAFKISRNGVAIIDLIPVRRGTVGYLYDRVSHRLFGNAGTGDFTVGPDVVPVEYILQTGTQYIDTLYPMADTRREVITVDWSGHSTTNREFMAGAASGSYLIEMSPTGYYGTAPTNLSSIQVSQKDRIRWNYIVGSRPSLYINDVFAINDSLVRVPTGNIMTGGVGTSGQNFPKMKIYGLDIFTDADEQVRKMLPIRVGSGTTWEGAMMDVLTRRIYRNQGTGAFTYGNDLLYSILGGGG